MGLVRVEYGFFSKPFLFSKECSKNDNIIPIIGVHLTRNQSHPMFNPQNQPHAALSAQKVAILQVS